MSSHDKKKKIEDKIERAFDKAHKFADTLTYPLGPVDAVIHGTAKGVSNWLLDRHPGDGNNNCPSKPNCPSNPSNSNCDPTSQPSSRKNSNNNFTGNEMDNNSNINIGDKNNHSSGPGSNEKNSNNTFKENKMNNNSSINIGDN